VKAGLDDNGGVTDRIGTYYGYRVPACDPVAGRREHLAGRGIELCERLPLKDRVWSGRTEISAFDLLEPVFFRYVRLHSG
jgi:hypothetical protein